MRKLRAVGPKSVMKKVIDSLYDAKACHIQDHSKDEDFDIGSPLEQASHLSEQLVRVRSIISHLSIEKHSVPAVALEGINSKSKKIAEQVGKLIDEKRSLESQLSQLISKKTKLSLLRTEIPIEAFFSLKSMKPFVGFILQDCKEKIEAITGSMIYESYDVKGKIFCIVFVETPKAMDAERVLGENGFSSQDIKELDGLKGTPSHALKDIEKKTKMLTQSLSLNSSSLQSVSNQHSEFLFGAEEILSEELKKAEAPLRFGSTKELFCVTGWIPEKNLGKVVESLEKETKGRIFIETAKPIPHHDDVPTKLNNPKPINNFESLLKIFSWPKYGEIDPSFLMAFTLPLFFGMMLGDIGYGLISLVIFGTLRFRMPQFKLFFNVLIAASLSAILFGFLYGEVFGLEEINGHHLWNVLSRTHDISALMIISFIVGIIHVNLGLVLGFINEYRTHGIMQAITHKVSWMMVQVACAFWFLHVSGMGIFGMGAFYPAIVASVLAISLLLKGEGFMGLIELPSIISNIVSYARIMAVGLASVFLAMLINNTASGLYAMGMVWFIVLGIPLIIVGHGFNLALGIFSPFLHSVRLHYVEFFTKFYQGGGKEFSPFGVNEGK